MPPPEPVPAGSLINGDFVGSTTCPGALSACHGIPCPWVQRRGRPPGQPHEASTMVKHKATRVIPGRWYGSAAGLFHLIWLLGGRGVVQTPARLTVPASKRSIPPLTKQRSPRRTQMERHRTIRGPPQPHHRVACQQPGGTRTRRILHVPATGAEPTGHPGIAVAPARRPHRHSIGRLGPWHES
jgi:hypothetical protein